MLLSEGQMSDYKGAALMLTALPKAKELVADKATTPIGSAPPWQSAASPPASPRNPIGRSAIPYDALLYKQRHKMEDMFGRLKDWRRIEQPDTTSWPAPSLSAICVWPSSRRLLALIRSVLTLDNPQAFERVVLAFLAGR